MRNTYRSLRASWVALASAVLLLASCAPAQPAPSAQPAAPAPQAPAASAAPAAPQPVAPAPAVRPSPTPQPTATATPVGTQIKKGGILKVMSYADPGTLDLLSATSTIVIAPLGLSYDGLVKEDPLKPGQLAPDLAERWDVSGDGRKVTFSLRKGVTFHNGKPFTSADAKVSFERFMTDNEQLAPALRAVVATVETPDLNTLVLNLKFPYPDLFKGLMMRWDSVVPAEHRTEKDIKGIIGTGPFKFKSYQSGVSWDTVRNEKYWNPGLPHMDGVTVYIIPDRNTGLAAFRAGRVDITAGAYLTVPQYKIVESQMKGQATAYLYPNSYWWNLYMPNNKKPWSDPRVRKAAFMVIDRKQAVQTVDQGLGGADGLLPPMLGGMTQDELKSIPGWREPKSVDIAEARKLMADAGYPNGFKTDIFYRQGSDYESMAVYVRDQLQTLGIESVI
ncbi:MAG: ABC transporter substrate-binding protein, partial [Chloroflexota bacterium]